MLFSHVYMECSEEKETHPSHAKLLDMELIQLKYGNVFRRALIHGKIEGQLYVLCLWIIKGNPMFLGLSATSSGDLPLSSVIHTWAAMETRTVKNVKSQDSISGWEIHQRQEFVFSQNKIHRLSSGDMGKLDRCIEQVVGQMPAPKLRFGAA